MNKVSIIGPFPDPITGMSFLNQVLYKGFLDRKYDVDFYDTILKREFKSKQRQGKFELSYFFLALFGMLKLLFFIVKRNGGVFYFTPAQSMIGFLRFLPAFILAKIFGKRTIVHIHGSRFSRNFNCTNLFFKVLVRFSLIFIDRFILLGESLRQEHQNLLGKSKIYVCRNGVKAPHLTSHMKGYLKKINVLFLSNLMKDKGILDFFECIKTLNSERYEFHVAGIIEPAIYDVVNTELEQLKDKVVYHGAVYDDKKAALFNDAHIFVLPSYDEGQPVSIIEAYSYGCAVLTTNVGGVCDIFMQGKNGKYVLSGNPSSIADTLSTLSNSEYESYSKNNFAEYERNYTESKFISRLEGILF